MKIRKTQVQGPSWAMVGLALALAGCSSEEAGADTNTSWQVCDDSNPCAAGECVVGQCVVEEPSSSAPTLVEGWDIELSVSTQANGLPRVRFIDGQFVSLWTEHARSIYDRHHKATFGADGVIVSRAESPEVLQQAMSVAMDEAGRVATTYGGSPLYLGYGQVFSGDLQLVGEATLGGQGSVVAVGGGKWGLAREQYTDGNVENSVVVELFDPTASQPLAQPIPLGSLPASANMTAQTDGSRTFVSWYQGGGAALRVVDGVGTGAAPSVTSFTLPSELVSLGVASVQGRTLIFGADQGSLWVGEVSTGVTEIVARPIAPTETSGGAVAAVAPERGVVGVCYVVGAGSGITPMGVAFVVVDADGKVAAGPVTLGSNFYSAYGCDVAWSGEEFVVVYGQTGDQGSAGAVRARRFTLSD